MDHDDPEYVLVKDFSEGWTTNDLYPGTLVKDPKLPTEGIPTPLGVLAEDFPRVQASFAFARSQLMMSAAYEENTDLIWQNKKTIMSHTLESVSFQKIEFETTPHTETILSRLREPEVCRALFNRDSPDWNLAFPVYMVIGVKIARGLKYHTEIDEYNILSGQARVPDNYTTHFPNIPTYQRQNSGQFDENANAVIAYKIYQIDGQSDGEYPSTNYIEPTRVFSA